MRYLKTISLISCLFIFSKSFSQSNDTDVMNVFKITILNPGISYEKALFKYQTFYAQAFINFSATMNEQFEKETIDINFYVDPAITGQYRFYYNFNKRASKNK